MDYEKFLDKVLEYAYETGSFNSLNIIEKAEHICIWGTGTMFHEAYEQYFVKNGIKISYLCDNDPQKWHDYYQGIYCISPSELEKLKGVVVVPLLGDNIPVEKQLRKLGITVVNFLRLSWDLMAGIPKSRAWFQSNISEIKQVYQNLADDRSREVYVNVLCNRIAPELSVKEYAELYDEEQYFCNIEEGYEIGKNEIFCDVGAYLGDTVERFLQVTGGAFEHIYAFELDPDYYKQCCKKIELLEASVRNRIQCYNYGLLDTPGSVVMGREKNGPLGGNSILKAQVLDLDSEEKKMGETVILDECLEGKSITLLKMDIEGAEQAALRGSKHLIGAEKPPKLAICIYHRLDDMWKIPLYIKHIVPEYKISIRLHVNKDFSETVCYAYL